MNSPETVEINSESLESAVVYTESVVDPIYERQKREVSQMRSSLLACTESDIRSVKSAMNNVLILRVIHQISRIIRFTEMLDKIEDKLYRSLDATLLQADELDPTTWAMLMKVQANLQNTMIESQKLLEPYAHGSMSTFLQDIAVEDPHQIDYDKLLYDQESRERIRQSAQAVLEVLNTSPLTGEDLPSEANITSVSATVSNTSDEDAENSSEEVDPKELAKRAMEMIKHG